MTGKAAGEVDGRTGREGVQRPAGKDCRRRCRERRTERLPNGRLEGLTKRLPRSLAGKGAVEIDREDAQRLDGKGDRRGCPERLAEYTAQRLAGKDWQRGCRET